MTEGHLYHYTCRDAVGVIGSFGLLKPAPCVAGGPPVIWLTDMETPERQALGLTSTLLSCDRTEYRYLVPLSVPHQPWLKYSRHQRLSRKMLAILEEFGRPETWFVALSEIPAALDASYGLAAEREEGRP